MIWKSLTSGLLQIVHDNYTSLITQLYPKDDPYILNDATAAVVNPLVVEFKLRDGDPKAELELKYDFMLAPKTNK